MSDPVLMSGLEGDESAAAVAAEAAAAAAAAPPQPSLFLDALPYLDTVDAQTQEQVQALLQEEMSSLTRTPDEYLQEFLQMRGYQQEHLKYESPLLAAGFAALSSGRPVASALDLSRYKLEAPVLAAGASVAAQVSAWRAAVDNAQAQVEHQQNRAVNLELLKKFGASAWKVHNQQLTAVRATLTQSLEDAKSQIEQVNRKRKSEQVAVGEDLTLLENGFYNLVWKNHEIQLACNQLEKQMQAKGIPVPPQLKQRKTEE